MRIGYARVSTDEQNLALQVDALRQARCDEIYEDHGVSGTQIEREGLSGALAAIGAGDTLVVWKLDRLGRSLAFLIDLINDLGEKGTGFHSLQDGIDTTTSSGKLVFHILGALAEFERDLIRERTKAGMKAARARGKHIGRPHKLTAEQIAHAREVHNPHVAGRRLADLANIFQVSTRTLSRALRTGELSNGTS